ncbi:tripartite tricarboxylate transporter TctB family protein [Pseudomonas stutzeri]|uniref:tripartite tricarboxylate transporter TctB family protein n=1 Tax=Stutzerimonas stutzeri TaxID=316 RepID=UPI00210CE172|nr:tripartite tricarboxylate transporter TctB family protein [Stutzerimonas stutzeri]MCQ4310392.1 tripartite tricarboxylate transporter TctB family protein [Stutzerimonas stutzeri]
MNKNRLALGLFGMALAAVFFVNAQGYPEAAAQMPLIYSVAVGLLALAMVCTELLRWRSASGLDAEPQVATEEGAPKPRYAVTALVFALAAAYVAVIGPLGYLLSTALFMALALLVIRTVSVRFAVIGTVVLVAVVCLVFVQFLGLPIPLLPPALS